MVAILPYKPSFGDVGLLIDESVTGALKAINAGEITEYSNRLLDMGLVKPYGDKLRLSEQGNYILKKEGLHGTMYVINTFNGNHSFAKPDDYEIATEEYRAVLDQSKLIKLGEEDGN
ncbi:MAG: hypothetical protein KAT28_05180 [Candidatus Aenigmarchaeota archaeon]|nr:hypothetical protein [Candidatus Aenigmarchaeota archaeon]